MLGIKEEARPLSCLLNIHEKPRFRVRCRANELAGPPRPGVSLTPSAPPRNRPGSLLPRPSRDKRLVKISAPTGISARPIKRPAPFHQSPLALFTRSPIRVRRRIQRSGGKRFNGDGDRVFSRVLQPANSRILLPTVHWR